MDEKITTPASIKLTIHGRTYTAEGIDWDVTSDELLEEFKGLMVVAGFSPAVLSDEFGHWEWIED